MVINRILQTEQDGDDPNIVYDFVVTALDNCVAKGANEYFVAFLYHGGGFLGFGGDNNAGRRRKPLQPNKSILNALTQALEDVNGAPNQYDAIGFGAPLMQAVGAADDYFKIAKCILVSEAVKPGHGECGLKLP
jgi:hypothetical protein